AGHVCAKAETGAANAPSTVAPSTIERLVIVCTSVPPIWAAILSGSWRPVAGLKGNGKVICRRPAKPYGIRRHGPVGSTVAWSGGMSDDFENHCWKDVISSEVIEIYSAFQRKTLVGPDPALLAIDLYEAVYRGGAQAPHQLVKTYPVSCGHYAYEAIEPTKRLFAAARA